MLKNLLKLANFFIAARNARVRFGAPKKSQVVILDGTSHEPLLELLSGYSYVIINHPVDVFYVNWQVIFSFFNGLVRNIHPSVAYSICIIRSIEPKIVITLIDNSILFYEVSRHCPAYRFLAIQNANRWDTIVLSDEDASKIYLPEFACFGDYERELYCSRGATVGRFHVIGSLRDAQYREKMRGNIPKKVYDICVVCEPLADGDRRYKQSGLEKSVTLILEYAIRFCEKHSLSLCIAGKRPDQDAHEREVRWYSEHLGKKISISKPVRHEFSTASLVDSSKVSLAQCSTALREGMGRGNKVLFCNFSSYSENDFSVEGVWSLRDKNFEAFERRLLLILQMDDIQFQILAAPTAKYIINYNEKTPTTTYLKNLICDAIEIE
jgi:surface carbohydrate biosynthesis protein